MVSFDPVTSPVLTENERYTATAREPRLLLEITRGRTRFPLRPIRSSRFLIGAAVTCDLRLGGLDMPALHSLIHITEEAIELQAIAAEPVLLVNGLPHRRTRLKDGDVIEIGEVELTARWLARETPAHETSDHETSAHETSDRIELEEAHLNDEDPLDHLPLSELSASQLLDLVDRELQMQQQYETGRRAGEAALLADVRNLQRQLPGSARGHVAEQPAGPHFQLSAQTHPKQIHSNGPTWDRSGNDSMGIRERTNDRPAEMQLLDLSEQLAALSNELGSSLIAAGGREGEYAQSLLQLLRLQQQLAEQLAGVTEAVEELRTASARQESARPRVSA